MSIGGGGSTRVIGGASVVLSLNANPFYGGLAAARRALAGFSGSASGGLSGLNSAFGRLNISVRALSVTGLLLGGAFTFKNAIDELIKMESQLVRLRRTLGETKEETNKLAMSFFEMAATIAGPSLENIINLSIIASRLGVGRKHIDLFTRDLAKVSAVLEDIPIVDAATRISGLNDVFGLAQTQAIRWASALNALDIQSNASAADILNISNRMSGAAATLGLTAQQTLSLATALRQARVPLETAGTAMSQILGRMTSIKGIGAFAKVAGMSLKDFRDTMEKFPLQAFIAVEKGLGRMSAIERFQALDRLRLDGQRVRLVMLQMIPMLGQLNEFTDIANREWSSLSSITKGFNLQAQTAASMLTRMWNNIRLVAVGAGVFLLPVIKGLSLAFSTLAKDLRGVMGTGSNIKLMGGWGEEVGFFLESLGTMSRSWKDWAGIVGHTFNNLIGQFDANFTIFLVNGIRVIANFFNQLLKLGTKFFASLSKMNQTFGINAVADMPDFMLRFLKIDPVLAREAAAKANRKEIELPDALEFFTLDKMLAGHKPLNAWRSPFGEQFRAGKQQQIDNPGQDPALKLAGMPQNKVSEFLAGMGWGRVIGKTLIVRQELATDQAKAAIKDWFTRLITGAAAEEPSREARKAANKVLAGEQAEGLDIPQFAAGGRPRPGQPALVGEHGPELFVPDRPGRVVPDAKKIKEQMEILKKLTKQADAVWRKARQDREAADREMMERQRGLQQGRILGKLGDPEPARKPWKAPAGIDPKVGRIAGPDLNANLVNQILPQIIKLRPNPIAPDAAKAIDRPELQAPVVAQAPKIASPPVRIQQPDPDRAKIIRNLQQLAKIQEFRPKPIVPGADWTDAGKAIAAQQPRPNRIAPDAMKVLEMMGEKATMKRRETFKEQDFRINERIGNEQMLRRRAAFKKQDEDTNRRIGAGPKPLKAPFVGLIPRSKWADTATETGQFVDPTLNQPQPKPFVDPTIGMGAATHAANAKRTAELMKIGKPSRAMINAPAGNANAAALHPFGFPGTNQPATGPMPSMGPSGGMPMAQAVEMLKKVQDPIRGGDVSPAMRKAQWDLLFMNKGAQKPPSAEMKRAADMLETIKGPQAAAPQDAAHAMLTKIQGERKPSAPVSGPRAFSRTRAMGSFLSNLPSMGANIVGAGLTAMGPTDEKLHRLGVAQWRARMAANAEKNSLSRRRAVRVGLGAMGRPSGRLPTISPTQQIYAKQAQAQARRRQAMFIASGGPAAQRARARQADMLRKTREPAPVKGKDWRDEGKSAVELLGQIVDLLEKKTAIAVWGQ